MNIYKWNKPNTKYPDFNQIIPITYYKNNKNIKTYKYIFTILIISIIIIIILSYYNGNLPI